MHSSLANVTCSKKPTNKKPKIFSEYERGLHLLNKQKNKLPLPIFSPFPSKKFYILLMGWDGYLLILKEILLQEGIHL